MRALNEKESILLHVKFALHMVVLVSITLFFIFTFLKTSESEVYEINLKSSDSDRIYYEQIALTDDIEDFFARYATFDASDEVKPDQLMLSIVDRKMEINKKISKLPENDVKIHSFMMSKVDAFLRLRDSISAVKEEEFRVKKDYLMCSGDYKLLKDIENRNGVLNK